MHTVVMLLKHVGVGVGLIIAASALLLFSDPKWNRTNRENDAPRKIAIVNYTSVPVLEEGEAGLIAGLAEGGFIDGVNVDFTRYNAGGDHAAAILIAKEVTGADYDMILTLSTPVLQAVANTNQASKKTHVFTLTTDPWGAGIGISREDPSQHPPYMTGQGSLQPVRALFDLARQANPRLKKVGVVWNPAESNSEASTIAARTACRALGIELLEGTVDSSSAVLDTTKSLVARECEAIWAGGDSTVSASLETLIAAAHEGGALVFTNMPSDVKRGAVFSLGADYYAVGYASGLLAARVLRGTDPASIPVENVMPEVLAINEVALEKFASTWNFGADWREKAQIIVDRTGVRDKERPGAAAVAGPPFHGVAARYGRPAKVAFVQLVESSTLDEARRGLFEGLTEAGLVRDRDVTIQEFSAQGDLSQLPQIFQAVKATSPDLIVTSTTPAMIAAARATDSIPIVFTVASEPSAVGVYPAGEQRRNLTGVFDDPPMAKLLDLAERREGALTTVGTIWNPAEPNSEISVKRLRQACQERGIRLVERNASSTNELSEVTAAICLAGVDLIVISADNVTSSGFPAIYSVTRRENVPVYCTEPDLVASGAAGAIGVDYYDWGRQSALLAARILAGQDPGTVPTEKVSSVRTVTAPGAGR